jgi:putative sterol carrier protein
VARFLSPDWLAAASAAASGSAALATATAGVRLVVQQVVTGGPDGEVTYVVAIDDGRVSLRVGNDGGADVTFTVGWETAVAMSTGALGGQEAFTTGRLRLGGDVGALLRHGPALAGLDAVFAGVRERTTY